MRQTLRQFLVGADRAQSNLVALFLGLLIAVIVVVDVYIPTVNDALASSNISGTAATILGLLPLFAALLILVANAGPLMNRVG